MCFFFFNDTATTEIYTLSLHDALPISDAQDDRRDASYCDRRSATKALSWKRDRRRSSLTQFALRRADRDVRSRHRLQPRSEEHTSELQSPCNLVCRLLLEKKKTQQHGNENWQNALREAGFHAQLGKNSFNRSSPLMPSHPTPAQVSFRLVRCHSFAIRAVI